MKSTATGLYPFVPSGSDFASSLRFFCELGFTIVWQQEGIAGLRFGGAYFLLQDIDVPQWQKNQMRVVEVDDLDGYWVEIEAKDLGAMFAGVKLRPPTDFAWGREIHVIDPGGVCWHFRQASAA
jgi:hypothetical protein